MRSGKRKGVMKNGGVKGVKVKCYEAFQKHHEIDLLFQIWNVNGSANREIARSGFVEIFPDFS